MTKVTRSRTESKAGLVIALIITVVVAFLPAEALFGATPARADVVAGTLDVATNPTDIAIDSTGTYAYAAGCDPHTGIVAQVIRIDLATFTIDDTLPVASDGACVRAVAVVDDSLLFTTDARMYRVDASTFGPNLDDSVAITTLGVDIAVHGAHAYITHMTSDRVSKVDISGPTLAFDSLFSSGGSWPMGIAIEPSGVHGYVANAHSDSLAKIRLSDGATVATIATGNQSYGIKIDQAGAFAYVPAAMPDAGQAYPWLVRVDLATFTWDDTVDLPFQWGFDIALTPDGAFGYVGESRSGNPGRIAKVALGPTMSVVETINSSPGSHALTVDPAGTYVYSADYNDHNQTTISKIAITGGAPRVTGLTPSTGSVSGGGTTVISGINFTGLTGVQFGASAATILSSSDDTIEVSVPPAASPGVENVTVTTPIGTSTQTVTYTYTADPVADDPQPSVPASAPGAPVAQALDGSAIVRWAAPESTGSFPVSTYLVRSTPGGRVCLTSDLNCEVTGLEPGVDYTFTVRALSGAGWSAESEPSNVVTLVVPTITISGERNGKRLLITGQTTGMEPGTRLTPWTTREARTAIKGRQITVADDGSFIWTRRASKKVTWQVRIIDGNGVRSNILVFR